MFALCSETSEVSVVLQIKSDRHSQTECRNNSYNQSGCISKRFFMQPPTFHKGRVYDVAAASKNPGDQKRCQHAQVHDKHGRR